MTDEIKEMILSWAKLKTCLDINPNYAAWRVGNTDDVYQNGIDDGKIILARKILEKMGIAYD